jgi:hypothetical protein
VHLSTLSVVRVLLTATSPSGDRFAVVLCTDDTLCITRNESLIRELCWRIEAVDECIAQFLELTRMW